MNILSSIISTALSFHGASNDTLADQDSMMDWCCGGGGGWVFMGIGIVFWFLMIVIIVALVVFLIDRISRTHRYDEERLEDEIRKLRREIRDLKEEEG
jgi:Na+-transporting methylmalonyl-CoA/oxaloacetate decarboxylase gamma subunit